MRDLPLLGFGLPVSGSWATPATMLHVARRAEALGYAALCTFQRVLRPADVGSVDEGTNPSARPAHDPSYHAVHDPLAPLAYVAGHTNRIALGNATICAPFTAPRSARQVRRHPRRAVDRAPGHGTGDRLAAARVHRSGGAVRAAGGADGRVPALPAALWTQDPVEFIGEFYTIPRSH